LAYPLPVRPADSLKMLGLPTFVVAGGADALAQSFLTELRSGTQGNAILPEILEIPGARHHFLARDLPAYDMVQAEAAWTQITAFLRRQLLPPPPKPPTPPVAKPAAPPAPLATANKPVAPTAPSAPAPALAPTAGAPA
jgi:hypothetical protein